MKDKSRCPFDCGIKCGMCIHSTLRTGIKTYSFNEDDLAEKFISEFSVYYAEEDRFKRFTIVKTRHGKIKIHISDINFIRRDNGAAVYHMRDKRTFAGTTLRTSFKIAVNEMTMRYGFIAAGVSRVLNPVRIETFYNNTVRFDNGEEEYLSDRLYYQAKYRYEIYLKRLAEGINEVSYDKKIW